MQHLQYLKTQHDVMLSKMNRSEPVEMLMRVSEFIEQGKRNFPVFSKHFDRCYQNIMKEVYSNAENRNQETKKQEILETSLTDYVETVEEKILGRQGNQVS